MFFNAFYRCSLVVKIMVKKSVIIRVNQWPKSFLCVFAPLRDKICEILRNPRINNICCSSLYPKAVFPRFSSETQAEN